MADMQVNNKNKIQIVNTVAVHVVLSKVAWINAGVNKCIAGTADPRTPIPNTVLMK